tara:strand:+ start:210 stop:542 length:333 start_codon:yes stop_codon:yes gene_type:complete
MTIALILLSISVLLNVVLVWYLLKVLAKLLYTSDNLGDLYIVAASYSKFVEELYGMDMFYGEPTIQELVLRSKELVAEIQNFESIYELTTDLEDGMELDDENSEEKTEED